MSIRLVVLSDAELEGRYKAWTFEKERNMTSYTFAEYLQWHELNLPF